jgi:hypothetical protein
VLFDANKATGRRQHNWVLDKTFDERDGAMDYAKEGGFAQYKGSGDYAATTLRCTKHEGCWEKNGAMLRIQLGKDMKVTHASAPPAPRDSHAIDGRATCVGLAAAPSKTLLL